MKNYFIFFAIGLLASQFCAAQLADIASYNKGMLLPMPEDSILADTLEHKHEPKTKETDVKKLPIIKRKFNYAEQVRMAMIMMGLVAIMMFSSQELNPR